MRFEQSQKQQAVLAPVMRHSLQCLQMSAYDLFLHVQDEAMENPMLDVDMSSIDLLSDTAAGDKDAVTLAVEDAVPFCRGAHSMQVPFAAQDYSHGQSLQEHLHEQLGQSKWVDPQTRRLGSYLIDCLDSRGYLDCPLEVLAEELAVPVSLLEQALFAVQMLEPTGVGARTLSECLVLQLAQGQNFNAVTLGVAQNGLELLAARRYPELARRLGVDKKTLMEAVAAITALNPIPAQGYGTGESGGCILPDAVITVQDGNITLELNHQAMPCVSMDKQYRAMLQQTEDAAAAEYLKEKLRRAEELIDCLQNRKRTLTRLLTEIIQRQYDFFCGESLQPMTIQDVAGALGVNPSTVSRAIQEEYVLFRTKIIPLRSLFTQPAAHGPFGSLSPVTIHQRIQRLIAEEPPGQPISDEALAAALTAEGICISRRTVAKYRTQLQIPPSTQRLHK